MNSKVNSQEQLNPEVLEELNKIDEQYKREQQEYKKHIVRAIIKSTITIATIVVVSIVIGIGLS